MLPVFGIDIGVDSASSIQGILSRLAEKGTTLCISDLSPFEAFIKAYRIAEKLKDERGKEEAKLGLLFVVRERLADEDRPQGPRNNRRSLQGPAEAQ
jgi:hypothetical protein